MMLKRAIVAAVLVHLVAAWFSKGWHHPDEQYQLIEFAWYKFSDCGTQHLSWEFQEQMRPGFQPFVAWAVMQVTHLSGIDHPFIIAFLLRLLTGLLSILVAIHLQRSLNTFFKTDAERQLHQFVSLFGWGLVYVHLRFSSETWGALFFTLALSMLMRKGTHAYFLFGLLAGIAFLCRYQSAFFLPGMVIWLFWVDRCNWRSILKMATAFIIALALGLLTDYWLYGKWVFPPWNYFYQNIFLGKAATFGTQPWYWYVQQLTEKLVPPFSLLLLAGFVLSVLKYYRQPITLCVFFFVSGHMLVSHKEFRFLFELAFFVPFMIVVFVRFWNESPYSHFRWFSRGFRILFYGVNAACLLVVGLSPAFEMARVQEFVYNHAPEGVLLVYEKEHPYKSGSSDARFNRKANLVIQSAAALNSDSIHYRELWVIDEHWTEDADSGGAFYRAVTGKEKLRVVYQTYPPWLRACNVNHWLDRVNYYRILVRDKK